MSWRTALVVLAALAAGFGVLLQIALRGPQPPEHQVFINGEVFTMDARDRVVEALSVRGDRIESVGSTEDIMALVEDATEVTDLRGRSLLPGFIDAHGHFPYTGMSVVAADLSSPPVGTVRSMDELLAALSERARNTPAGEWVMGTGYDDTLLAEARHPTRAELDAVSTEHPLAIAHVSGHMLVANSRALALVGIDADTPDPVGGVIGRRPGSTEPNGLLEETARLSMAALMQDIGMTAFYRIVKSAVQEYAAAGVTTAQSGGVVPALYSGLGWLSRLGVIPQRLVVFPFDHEFGEALLDGSYDPGQFASDRFLAAAIKLVADGSIQGYTGYLSQPYHRLRAGDPPGYRGYPTMPPEVLAERVLALHRAGYQLAIHGNGDAAIDDILDAFEAAQRAHPVSDPRLIVIHAQMAREDQVARMAQLGATPSFFSAHTFFWGDRHRDIFMGPERAANMSPARWAQEQGLRFSSHLDAPVVPMQPLQAVWSMVNRQSASGEVIGDGQRIGVMDALRAVTIDAAWQVRLEHQVGSLEPGKFADLVILSGNPLQHPAGLRDLRVERTVLGGVTLFRR